MKKAIKVTLGIAGGIIVIAAIASSTSKSNTQSVPSSNSNASQQSADQKPSAEKMTIKNSAYQEADGLKQVVGEITNNDTGKHTATIKATFYSADGKILGTAVGSVNDVAPSETKTFNLYTNDEVTGYKDMKVQVDTLI
jgi:hypothetical protein